MVEIRPVRDRVELEKVFHLVRGELSDLIETSGTLQFSDLAVRFPQDQPLVVVATTEEQAIGAALAFRNNTRTATLRAIAVVDAFRQRGIGRLLVERVETGARLLGVDQIALGTHEAVWFWCRLGYTPRLLLQWVYDAEVWERESNAVLGGPLAGLRHWRSSYQGVRQLYVEVDEPRPDLRDKVREMVSGCHVGFMLTKQLSAPHGAKS